MACAEYWEFIGMGVGGIGDAQLCLDAVNRIEEHVSLHLRNVPVKSVGAGNHAGDRGDNSIKARRGVVAKFNVWVAGGKSVVHLENFYYYRIVSRAGRSTSIAARIEEIVVFTMVHEAAELDSKNQTIVSFIQVNNP